MNCKKHYQATLAHFIILCFLLTYQQSSGQNVSVALGRNKSTYYPFYRFFGEPFYPAIQSSFEYPINSNTRHQLFIGLQICFSWHKIMGNNMFIGTSFSYRYHSKYGIYPELGLGSGINLLFPARTLYSMSHDANWIMAENQLQTSYQLPLYFSFGKKFNQHDFFLRYQYNILLDFNESVSILPVDNFLIGYRYHLKPHK